MEISSLNSIISGIERISSAKNVNETEEFSELLSNAIDNAQETETAAKEQNVNLLTGESDGDSIHTAMIEAQKAELALNLAIQIRNKVIEAYDEVMNMQL